MTARAKALGFTSAETPKLALAVRIAAKSLGIPEADALNEIGTPGSKANRLYEYGGRFLGSERNFKNGLRLLDEFAKWYDEGRKWYDEHTHGLKTDFSTADTITKLNSGTAMFGNKETARGLEAMIFEELANNTRYSLSNGSPEELFGFANNPASRFFGRDFHKSDFGTMANIPPQKRRVVFAAFDVLALTARDKAGAANIQRMNASQYKIRNNGIHIARVLKNFDALKALLDAGKLTAKEVVKICHPEIKNPGKDMLKAVNDFDNTIDDTIENELDEAADMSVRSIMQNTGCTLDEAVSAYKEGRAIPFAKYATGYSFSLAEYNAGGYGQVVGDLTRGYNYYEVARDDKTGAVTIRTYSPEALPVKFEWKTTVDRNGNCVSTPMTVTAK